MAKPALGRGLGALLGGTPPVTKPATPNQSGAGFPSVSGTPGQAPGAIEPAPPAIDMRERVNRVPLDRVHPSSLQPRKDFSPETLRELADSIKEQGIVQPLIVREKDGRLELIAGERRWRAAQLIGLAEVPVIIREADDRAVLEMALIENLQRENLNPIEEAQGYSQLVEQFQLKQEEVATKVGKSRAVVANAMRLLRLAPEIQTYIREGRISVGHAKVILGLTSEKQQRAAAGRVIKEGLNVRQTEQWVARLQTRAPGFDATKPATAIRDSQVVDLENKLRERLGTKVSLRYRHGKGALEIVFFSDDDLERVLQIIGVAVD